MTADFVALDSAGAMAQVCDHLVGNDYRELMYVTEPKKGVSSRRERTTAFEKCTSSQPARVNGQVFEYVEDNADELEHAVSALISRAKSAGDGRRAAIVSGNAVVTLRIASLVARCGWTFGIDIGFLGFDDPEWAPLIGPGLSAIAQPTDAIGRMAATCLIDRLQGEQAPPRQILMPGQLFARGSSGPHSHRRCASSSDLAAR
jgi:LacI family kdg operon repressor